VAVVPIAIGAVGGLTLMGICLAVTSAWRTYYWLQQTKGVVHFEWRELAQALGASAIVGIGGAIGPALAFAIFGSHPSNVWSQDCPGAAGKTP